MERRILNRISTLTLVAAVAGGWYGVWAKSAGFAVSSVSWGFAVVLLPLALGVGLLYGATRYDAMLIGASAQAAMTLAFSVFAFALRSTLADLQRIPWQVLVVLVGDVVVTTAGLGLAAAGAAYVFASWRGR